MRTRFLPVAFTAVIVGVALVAGAARGGQTTRAKPQAVFRTDRILMLAANGSRAAVVTSRKHGCGSVVVWTAPGRRVSRFALGELGCHFDGVDELALGGGQVAWIEAGGGNDLELTVMSGRLPRGRTKQLDYEVNGDRAGEDPTGGWVGNLVGAGSLLAYNRWQVVCDRPAGEECGNGDPDMRVTGEQLVRLEGGRAATTATGAGVYALAAAGGGRLAVVGNGGVATVTASGKQLAFVPDAVAAPRAVGLTPSALLLEQATTLALYDPVTGEPGSSIELGGAASLTLAGASERYALLAGKRRLVLVRLADGARAELARPPGSLVGARLTDAGLFYASDLAHGLRPGRIAFVPTRGLAAAF
jgi:hypothetical protein